MALPGQVPTSYAQRRLWFLDRLEGSSAKYNLSFALRLKGDLDVGALKQALQKIVERHESLRTRFNEVDGEPMQVIESAHEIDLPLEDISALSSEQQQKRIDAALHLAKRQPFDLARGPLMRLALFSLQQDEHMLLRTVHHIVWDAWSERIFLKELKALYTACRDGRENPLKPLEVQYKDFACWQRRLLDEKTLDAGTRYWIEQLSEIPEYLDLPTDRPRQVVAELEAGVYRVVLGRELVTALKRQSEAGKASLYMTMLAAFGTLLSRYSGQEDVVVGSPIANRREIQLEELIGFFLNTLAMRMQLHPGMTFRELLEQVRHTALEAYEHEEVPFERVVEELSPTRDVSRTPVFQVTFALEKTLPVLPGLNEQEFEPIAGTEYSSRFDLEVHALEQEGKIYVTWLYNRGLFDPSRIEQMAQHYVRLLNAVAANPDQQIQEIRLLSLQEREQLLMKWNATEKEYPAEKCVHELFEEQALQSPEAVAVVFEDQAVSYGELNRRSNQLAHYLRELGVRPDERVAICVERSLEMVVGLLAVLKAGGAYVPLDPGYPGERLQYMVEDSGPVALLTQGQYAGIFGEAVGRVPVLDLAAEATPWANQPETNPEQAAIGLTAAHLAYVIYTSGSTGRPKGVTIEHRQIVNYISAIRNKLGIQTGNTYGLISTFSADLGNTVLFSSLANCGALHVIPTQEAADAERFARFCWNHSIDYLKITPSHLQALLGDGGQTMGIPWQCVVFGGETLSSELVATVHSLLPECRIYNHYGPTECTVGTLAEEVTDAGSSRRGRVIPLGRPLANTKIYVLGRHQNAVPVGGTGEIYIGGAGVARGYLRRPELTAERFVPDLFADSDGARMYRTGDLGRWRPDGTVEFLGRNDFQVKIRGFRIELGEIDVLLKKHAEVRDAVVIAHEDPSGEKRLVAYYTPVNTNCGGSEAENLRVHLAATLPEYMVPTAYVRLDKLPLTPNGKLDRKALPSPMECDACGVRSMEEPVGEIETTLARIWGEVLKVKQVGRYDNFFKLGGNSLLIVRVITRLRKAGLPTDLRALFATPVLAELAAEITRQMNAVSADQISEIGVPREHLKEIEICI